MTVRYDILVTGSNVGFANGFLGWGMVTLIEADGQRILYDCGHAVTRMALRQGLARNGLDPADIDMVFLSHLHFDHCLNVDLFPQAKIMVSRAEWDYCDDPHPDDDVIAGFIRGVLEGMDLEKFDGEPEIAPGVSAFHAPGHTPGLYGLAFEHDDDGRVAVAGDAIKTARELISEEVAMEFDPQQRSSATIARIKRMADRIIPGHYTPFRKMAAGGFVWDEPIPLNLVIR